MLINYPKFKINIDPKSKKTQGLKVGDIVRRQYFDGKNTVYSLMYVLSTGIDKVLDKETGQNLDSPYFIGGLLEGDVPSNGQILDFARTTSMIDPSRSGALYLTAADSEAPYMSVIDKQGFEHSLVRPKEISVNTSATGKFCLMYNPATSKIKHYTSSDENLDLCLSREAGGTLSQNDSVTIPFKDTLGLGTRIAVAISLKSVGGDMVVPLKLGYYDMSAYDAQTTVSLKNNERQDCLVVVQIDKPMRDYKSLFINLSNLTPGVTLHIGSINIIETTYISTFRDAEKVRVGKMTGVVDPLYGNLEGYGVHVQNIYASGNVAVSGTLTAGDENGFGSTFYAGRIWKNIVRNSVNWSSTQSTATLDTTIPSPTGMGDVIRCDANKIPNPISLPTIPAKNSKPKRYTFSVWVRSDANDTQPLFQLACMDSMITVNGTGGEWRRVSVMGFASDTAYQVRFVSASSNTYWLSSPQLELGAYITQYQPTDNTPFNDRDDYGAWFCMGGIGGTIQNPLLRLDKDGSIRSNNDSFVINHDGSGKFSNGKINWDKAGNMRIGNWKVDENSIYIGTKHVDDSSFANDGITLYSDGTRAAIISKQFRIDRNGNAIFKGRLEAAQGHFSGKVEAASGKIGGWKIDSDSIHSGTKATLDKFTDTPGITLWSDGTKAAIMSKNFKINSDGSVHFKGSGTFDGTINATSGLIGKWTVDTDSIYTGTKATVDATENVNGITLWSNGTQAAIMSKNFTIKRDGSVHIKGNGTFSGEITAASGTIGGWKIANLSITKNSVTLGSDGSITHANRWALNNDGSGSLAGGKINWTNAGVMRMGGWIVDADAIYVGTKQVNDAFSNNGITIYSNGTVAAIRTPKFRIDTNGNAIFKGTLEAATGSFSGELKAATGSFSGTITASGGAIGGWNIAPDFISKGNVKLDSFGNINCGAYWGINNDGSAKFSQGKVVFNRDGSGYIGNADKKISWDASGKLTVGSLISAETIQGMNLAFTQGKIGGWTIESTTLKGSNTTLNSNGSISGHGWALNDDGSGNVANNRIKWKENGDLDISGKIVALDESTFGGFTIVGETLKNNTCTIAGNSIWFASQDGKIYSSIGTGMGQSGTIYAAHFRNSMVSSQVPYPSIYSAALRLEIVPSTGSRSPNVWLDCDGAGNTSRFRVETRKMGDNGGSMGYRSEISTTCMWLGKIPSRNEAMALTGGNAYKVELAYNTSTGAGLLCYS